MGYVQGMSFVAATILLAFGGNEYETFKLFANLLNRDILFNFYQFDMQKVNIVFNVFMKLMRDRLPNLYSIFNETGLSCSVFLFEWIVALFSNIFPFGLTTRLWDNYFFYGDFFLMKLAIAICTTIE